MPVRARFYISTVTLAAGDTATANLSAVTRGKENSMWSKFTPAGTLNLSLTREADGAKKFFLDNIGKEVFLDISLADDPICTQCDKPIPAGTADYGVGVHAGNDVGYIPGEFVHNSCMEAAQKRLGLS